MSDDQEAVKIEPGEELFPKGLSVASGLEKIRKRLLDLTLRNKLINFYKLPTVAFGSLAEAHVSQKQPLNPALFSVANLNRNAHSLADAR